MTQVNYQRALEYVITTCCTLSKTDFLAIVSPEVELKHRTNREKIVSAKGAEPVTALFDKYVFTNTSNIDIKSMEITAPEKDIVVLNLVVEEDKTEDQKTNRCLFKETTLFKFDPYGKISSIETIVKKISNICRSKL